MPRQTTMHTSGDFRGLPVAPPPNEGGLFGRLLRIHAQLLNAHDSLETSNNRLRAFPDGGQGQGPNSDTRVTLEQLMERVEDLARLLVNDGCTLAETIDGVCQEARKER